MTTAVLPANKLSSALLLALEALATDNATVSRPALERFVCEAAAAGVLAAFQTPMWRRRLYEALAHLEQTSRITRSAEGYRLTASGRSELDGLDCSKTLLASTRAALSDIGGD